MAQMRTLIMVSLAVAVSIVALALLVPVDENSGRDWRVFAESSRRVIRGQPLYGEKIGRGYYYNPPWLAWALSPIALLPLSWGRAVMAAITLVVPLTILRRWRAISPVKAILALLSPPILYVIFYGQVDALLLGGLLLPASWWPLVAVTKPQAVLGLAFGLPLGKWPRAAAIVLLAGLVSLALCGNWVSPLLSQPMPGQGALTHNWWVGLWPSQVTLGLVLLTLGITNRDERLLAATSPFLMPYATTASLLGPWLAALAFLKKDWQAALVWAAWWGASIYRAVL
jgi:hypothetical protein